MSTPRQEGNVDLEQLGFMVDISLRQEGDVYRRRAE